MFSIIDEQAGETGQCYILHRVYLIGTYRVRVRILRDTQQIKSHAVAEVLSNEPSWIELAVAYTSNWYRRTPSFPTDIRRALDGLARELADRAAVILGVTNAPEDPA
jgi:hypothetical protein